jgi:dual 3',5'-cyclic-AMP and -GMP phosphodiesterase 11
LPRFASKHFELKRELRKQDDRAFFLDIVKDIANDLDLCSLTKKITDNMAILLDAEAASLFIVQGPRGGKQTLVSKVGVKKFCLFLNKLKEMLGFFFLRV